MCVCGDVLVGVQDRVEVCVGMCWWVYKTELRCVWGCVGGCTRQS